MIASAEASHNADTEVKRFSHTQLLRSGTASPHRYTVANMGEDETFDKESPDTFWQLVSDTRKTHEHAVTSLNDCADMTAPLQVLIDDNTQHLDALFGENFIVAEMNGKVRIVTLPL